MGYRAIIKDKEYELANTLSVDRVSNAASSASLTIKANKRLALNPNTSVSIYKDSALFYVGYLSDYTSYHDRGIIKHDMQLLGREQILDKIIVDVEMETEDETTTLSAFISKLKATNDISPLTNITYISSLATLEIEETSVQDMYLSDFFDSLCDSNGLQWFLDDTVLSLKDLAPSNTVKAVYKDSDALDGDLAIKTARNNYCNAVRFTEGYTTYNKTYEYSGDGDRREFAVGKMYRKPIVQVLMDSNQSSGGSWVTVSVGDANREDESNQYKFYWSQYDNVIVHNSNEPVLVVSDKIRISSSFFLKNHDRNIIVDELLQTNLERSGGALGVDPYIYDSTVVVGLNNLNRKARKICYTRSKTLTTAEIRVREQKASNLRLGDTLHIKSDTYNTDDLFIVSALNFEASEHNFATIHITAVSINTYVPMQRTRDVVKKSVKQQIARAKVQSGNTHNIQSKTLIPERQSSGGGNTTTSQVNSEKTYVLDIRDSAPQSPKAGQMWLLK